MRSSADKMWLSVIRVCRSVNVFTSSAASASVVNTIFPRTSQPCLTSSIASEIRVGTGNELTPSPSSGTL